MGDVVSVEVDGEPGEPRFLAERGRPRWGMPVAVGVVVAMLFGLGWTIMRSAGTSGPPSAAPPAVTTPTSAAEAPSTSDAPLVRGGSSTTVTTSPAAATQPVPDVTDPVTVTQAALTAWGEFAVSGDLSRVRPLFASDGPQLAQLQSEAASTHPGGTSVPGYQVTLSAAEPTVAGSVATVVGTVVWSRAAEADQTYRWAIELHRADDGTWRLFTVRTAGA